MMETQILPYATDFRMGLPENVILSTHDYEMFRLDPLNRPLDHQKVNSLAQAIAAKSLLQEYPILVTSDLVIVDGQHRHAAAKRVGATLYFQVSPRIKIEDAATVNGNTSDWRLDDWLHHWCQRGAAEYLALKEFRNRYSWMTLSMAYHLCFRGDHGGRSGVKNTIYNLFRQGRYTANNLEFAVKVADAAETFRPWVKFWRDKSFISAIANAHRIDGYDHARMLRKMEYLSSRLVKCADLDSYCAVFTEIYNYKERFDSHLLFKRTS